MGESEQQIIGGFRVIAKLRAGTGAQGTVYKAVCENDNYPKCPRGTIVALKTMPVTGEDGERSFARLRRQTEILTNLEHPNVVRYYGCFSEQSAFSEFHAVVEDLLTGESLKDLLERHPNGLDADEAVRIVSAMVAGLQATEQRGIVHRDVKPANVFICVDGSVKLIDFEVAEDSGTTVSSLSGNMVGSFDYMAPDFTDPHFSGDELSDVFSAGVVMHEVFSGRLPYARFPSDLRQANFAFLERWARDSHGAFASDAVVVSSRVERFVANVKAVLQRALDPRRERRLASFNELAAAIANIRFRDLRNGNTSYRMLQLVGKGGFGEVFKARSGGRTVAVKHLLKSEYASRFYREAKIMSKLDDPCFVRFFDFFVLEHGGQREAFLVMDFLPGMPGSSLRDAIRRSAGSGMDYDSVLCAFIRYAHGLKVIHSKGVFHRDIKPTNLYYPEDRPGDAAIMDLGIARETDGTATTGQVPGTLDYMPPETAMQGTRGDAAMDLYALGLCLYEALTGKKGFPRLPNGSAAYAQFFKRAQEKARPKLDDPRLATIPELLDLIVHLTEPEVKLRLSDAGVLERELTRIRANLNAGDAVSTTHEATNSTASPLSPDDEATETGDSATAETAFLAAPSAVTMQAQANIAKQMNVLEKEEAKRDRSERHLPWGKIAAISVLTVGIFSAWVMRHRICSLLGIDRATSQEVSDVYTPNNPDSAGLLNPNLDIPDLYGEYDRSIEQADKLRDEYLANHRPPALTESEYRRAVDLLANKREQRLLYDRLQAERTQMEGELKNVLQTYRKEGLAAGDKLRDEWMDAWGKNASKDRISEAMRNFTDARNECISADEKRQNMKLASKEADKLVGDYATGELALVDREYGVWRNNWQEKLSRDDFAQLKGKIEESRTQRCSKLEQEKRQREANALLAECHALCMLMEPVHTRMDRLDDAEQRLKAGRRSSLLSAQQYAGAIAEVSRCRSWTVFEIANNTDLVLTVDGRKIANGSTAIFSYTNAVPDTLAATAIGYEPLSLGHQTNGKRLRLLPEHFTLLKVAVQTAKFPSDVICQVDGVSVQPNVTIKLMPGSHECTYLRNEYRKQAIPFKLNPGEDGALPPPGEWARSEEWLQRDRERQRLERAAEFERTFLTTMNEGPVTTRVARLYSCARSLSAPQTAALIGAEKRDALDAMLKRERARGIGIIANRTQVPWTLLFGGKQFAIPAKADTTVEFAVAEAPRMKLNSEGYEDIAVPDGFNGAIFAITDAQLRPTLVKVMLPPKLNGDIVCLIDGSEVKGPSIKLAPGPHTAKFRRPDYSDVQYQFDVKVATPMTMPIPRGWQATVAMAHLAAAEEFADQAEWDQAAESLKRATVTGPAARERKAKLEKRLQKHEKFKYRQDKAASWIRESRWTEATRAYAELWLEGCELTVEERTLALAAGERALDDANFRLQLSKRRSSNISSTKVDQEIREINIHVGVLRAAAATIKEKGKTKP